MVVWLLQTGEIVPFKRDDHVMRTGHLANELSKKGHRVYWWTSAFEHQKRRWIDKGREYLDLNERLRLVFLKGCGYKKNLSFRRYWDHLLVSERFMSTAVKYPKPNIIVAAVPEHNLAYRGVRFAKKNGIPCMVDLRDPWPDFFLDFVRSPVLKLFVRLFLVKDYYRSRYTLKNADSVVSMMDSLLRWGQIKGRRTLSQMDRVFYLGANEPNIADTKDLEPEFCDMINRVKGRFNALFLGTVNNYYNPVTIVRAARILNDRIKEGHRINCIIAGSGDLLEETIREAKGMPNVLFTGWVDEKKISALLSNSTVGIIPAQLETDVFPNKAFTYFSGGLPVISSAVGELAALISKKRLGLNFERENHVQLAEILIELIKNPLRIADIKANVARTFEDEFSVPRIYGKFVEHVEAVATKRLSVSK